MHAKKRKRESVIVDFFTSPFVLSQYLEIPALQTGRDSKFTT